MSSSSNLMISFLYSLPNFWSSILIVYDFCKLFSIKSWFIVNPQIDFGDDCYGIWGSLLEVAELYCCYSDYEFFVYYEIDVILSSILEISSSVFDKQFI